MKYLQHRTMTNKTIIPIRYNYCDNETHFENLIEKNDAENTIFIYNENVKQWKKKNDYHMGGGNAIMRPYRLDGDKGVQKTVTLGSWGIPTGYRYKDSYHHAKKEVIKKLEHYIDIAFDELIEYIKAHPSINTIYYSSDKKTNDIGIEIFERTLGETKKNVSTKFNEGFDRLVNELKFTKQTI